MKKPLFLFLLFVAFLSSFLGFEQRVSKAQETSIETAQTETNAFRIVRSVDDKISVSYLFPVNSVIFEELGYSQSQIKVFRFYLSLYIASIASQNEARAGDGVQVGKVTYFDDIDCIGFSILFEDLKSQQEFFGSDSSSTSDMESSGFFMTTTKIYVDFPISSTSADSMKLVFSYAVTSWAQNEGISDTSALLSCLDQSLFIYEFVTTQSTLKSDCMCEESGIVHHYFLRDQSNLSERICFFYTVPNVPIWYLSALILTIFGMFTAYFVLRRKSRKNIEK